MSTQERYGREVLRGLMKHQAAHEAGECGMWASAAQVGERAGVSTMTARKYLRGLVARNKAVELVAGKSSYFMIARS